MGLPLLFSLQTLQELSELVRFSALSVAYRHRQIMQRLPQTKRDQFGVYFHRPDAVAPHILGTVPVRDQEFDGLGKTV